MGKAYYYFAASLPSIEFEGKVSLTVEEFLGTAQRLLTTEDYHLLDALLNEKFIQTKNRVIVQWTEFNRQLRNALSMYRSKKANKDPLEYVRGDYFEDPWMQEIILSTEKASDPLEAEKILSKARWQQLSELEVGQNYTLECIIIYGLKLKILERYEVIQSPKGKEIYEQLKKINFPEGIASSASF